MTDETKTDSTETGTTGLATGSGAGAALDTKPEPHAFLPVYYNVHTNDPNAKGPRAIQRRPAIVTEVNADGTCDLAVFMKGHLAFQNNVQYGLTAGCWQPATDTIPA